MRSQLAFCLVIATSGASHAAPPRTVETIDIAEILRDAQRARARQLDIEERQLRLERARQEQQNVTTRQSSGPPDAALQDTAIALMWGCQRRGKIYQSAADAGGDVAETLGVFDYMMCGEYISGIVDMNAMGRSLFGASAFCFPPTGLSIDQQVRVFLKWTTEHPESLHITRRTAVIAAFAGAFPCTRAHAPDGAPRTRPPANPMIDAHSQFWCAQDGRRKCVTDRHLCEDTAGTCAPRKTAYCFSVAAGGTGAVHVPGLRCCETAEKCGQWRWHLIKDSADLRLFGNCRQTAPGEYRE